MHDRRVDGETLIFGNQGALFQNAMTWWDHETESIWSQPWGSALEGPLEGTALTLIPASVVPWSTWVMEHPETTILANYLDILHYRYSGARDDFVIGVALEDSATAYGYGVASVERVINDRIGEHPVVVFVDPTSRDIKVFLRRAGADNPGGPLISELVFDIDEDGQVFDAQTGSRWDMMRGVAAEGPLKGSALQQIPYVTSFDWAWSDFFPHTRFYEPE